MSWDYLFMTNAPRKLPSRGAFDLGMYSIGDLGDVDLVTIPPNDGQALTYKAATETWIPGDAGGVPLLTWTFAGNQTPVASPLRIYNTSGITRTIAKVFVSVNTPPTGSALIVDVHKNGTTIFTNQANRPQIAGGQYTGQSTTIDVIDWAPGDYLTVEVDQVGSTTPGADLTVHVACSENVQGGGVGVVDRLSVSTADVSNPPADAELDAIFGTPAVAGVGFVRLLDDGGADSNVYLVVSSGTSWWHAALTKAV